MPTILRFQGLRVVIFLNDHWPPHVHVVGAAREAKIALGLSGRRPALVSYRGLTRRELALALAEIERHHELLMERWREIHGDA
jgi:Domain of unknown function (DUF4160)